MKIGVISDTHGHLDSKVFDIFKGVDRILHGGDIGPPVLILELEEIAPVTAVPISTGLAVALNVLPAPSFSSSKCLACSKLTSMPKSRFNSWVMPGWCSIRLSS